jgi:hypothetical protein
MEVQALILHICQFLEPKETLLESKRSTWMWIDEVLFVAKNDYFTEQ